MSELIIFTVIVISGILVQAFAGFAGSLFAVPLYAIFFAPREILPAHGLVMLIVNVFLVLEGRKHLEWRSIVRLQIAGLIGVPLGALCLAYLPSNAIRMAISLITFVFGLLFLFNYNIRLRDNNVTQGTIGLVSGILGGSISESGPPVVIYGLARGWIKDKFRTNLLAYFLTLAVMTNLSYLLLGMFNRENLDYSLFAALPALAAGWLGTKIKDRVSDETHRKAIIMIALAVAVMGLLKSIF